MNEIKAIETEYAGCRFRSRLEARWAVFFDALRVQWEYEPQGYDIRGKAYLPDFWLPGSRLWVEVKGSEEALDVQLLVDAVIPHWGLPASPDGTAVPDVSRAGDRMLILGPIPRKPGPDVWPHMPVHTVLSFWKGDVVAKAGWFTDDGGIRVESLTDAVIGNDSGDINWQTRGTEWGNWTGGGGLVYGQREELPRRVMAAYSAARKARFEHGERG